MNILRSILNTISWMNPKLIPMRPSFHFSARLKDGRIVRCETYRKEFSIATSVRSLEGPEIKFADIQDWAGF